MILFLTLLQGLILVGLWRLSFRVGDVVMDRWFNPICLMILFYVLFFMLEQLSFLFTGQLVDGVSFAFAQDEQAIVRTQLYLVAFLTCAGAGLSLTRLGLPTSHRSEPFASLARRATSAELIVCGAFFVFGLAATIYLGVKFGKMNDLGQFRSALVKTADGRFATSVAFFGNFAASYIVFRFVTARQWLWLAAIVVIFGGAVLYTGSRGRLLWPIVIAAMAVFAARDKFPVGRLIVFALAGFVLLAMMDPLRKYLMAGGIGPFPSFSDSLAELFVRRNFDGFANLNLIINSGYFDNGTLSSLAGAREAFMDAFFPSVLRSGVAFGSTFPGYFYVLGGGTGLMVLSLVYGIVLGVLNWLQRRLTSVWLVFSLWFGMTFLGAVGGDLAESIAKLLAAIAPGVLLAIVAVWQRSYSSRSVSHVRDIEARRLYRRELKA